MRSRYTAFAVGDVDYLLATWHSRTRPARLDLDPGMSWVRLEIVAAHGGPFDGEGVVEFRAHYRTDAGRGVLHERSSFVRENARWYYVDGVVAPA